MVAGGGVYHFDGNKWEQKDSKLVNGQLIPLDQVLFDNADYTSIWGTSSKNFYVVGNNGNIAHYDGSKWTKIQSPVRVKTGS